LKRTAALFTVAIGCASALTAAAWQAIQPELVQREQIPAASTLSSVSANAAQAIGPAVGVLERFTVTSWADFERQHTERWLDSDHDAATKAVGYTVDNTRRHFCYLALRVAR
jgi:Transmembrane secretion effector